MNRRRFLQLSLQLSGSISTLLLFPALPGCTFFKHPTLLSARNDVDNKHWCVSYSLDGTEHFRTEVPQRCHDVLQHPSLPLALFVARRPGTHCYLIDTRNGNLLQTLTARNNRHFYGHGIFDHDGTLYLTENDTTEPGRGVLGIYHWRDNLLQFSDEISTHGIEPHQFVWLPDNAGFAIANGGIRTEAGSRTALDETIESSLVFMKKNGELISKETLSNGNSIRHIASAADGTIVTAQQFSANNNGAATLLAIKKPGGMLEPFPVDTETEIQLQAYSASVAIHSANRWLAVTAPRGNRLLLWHLDSGKPLLDVAVQDCAGITSTADGFIVSSGEGGCRSVQQQAGLISVTPLPLPAGGWDNHLILTT
ncbi:MAG TPA: DUF1513 domain-containing protein [Pseudomonadales bacterium]|nr:DUF1513 domain-containing protein [Pseudomonadales bacterium]